MTGFIGGLQGGYNYQIGTFVIASKPMVIGVT
jgi:hypothetical protein